MASNSMHVDSDPDVSSSDDDVQDAEVDGWEDVDGDNVPEIFTCLFDNETFDSINAMFEYCKVKYGFDIWKIQQQFDLDFLGLVKLVNYVRKSVTRGQNPDVSTKLPFDDDLYLLPTMESDAVLYNLEDVLTASRTPAKTEIEELQEQMSALQVRFDAYRKDVAQYLGENFDSVSAMDDHKLPNGDKQHSRTTDSDYFHSYSFNAIHETMLKDRIRTDAYRDFIYDNKHIFRDKVVLDVGCGTGILSMFCARAGAKQVIAVDNSDIIGTARNIVRTNGLDDVIHCIRGKIEEVQLPVDKVDIIVSEWMGYCLLFESMLDSVIYARDRYLAPGGLMVPSHASLKIDLLADSELRDTHIDFWNDVYGFDMRQMEERAQEECLIRVLDPEDLSGEASTFNVLNLHTTTLQDLSFERLFAVKSSKQSQVLDGFAIWFDIFFATSPEVKIMDEKVETARRRGLTAFSTSPYAESTHWQQGVCFSRSADTALQGKTVRGKIAFKKRESYSRGLSIDIEWQTDESSAQAQRWHVE